MEKTVRLLFEDFPEESLSVMLFRNVENMEEIKEEIVKGRMDPEAAFINARMVPDAFIVHVAGRSVIGSNKDGKLKTRSLHAELVFCISASKHIGESLKRFGANETCQDLLVARFNATPEDLKKLSSAIKGEQVGVEELSSLAEITKLREIYKINDDELEVGTLVDAIVCRIGARDVLQ